MVFGVLTLMFFLLRLAPGDPARLLVGPAATEEQVASQRRDLGLDRPLPAQYATWLGRSRARSPKPGRPPSASWGSRWF